MIEITVSSGPGGGKSTVAMLIANCLMTHGFTARVIDDTDNTALGVMANATPPEVRANYLRDKRVTITARQSMAPMQTARVPAAPGQPANTENFDETETRFGAISVGTLVRLEAYPDTEAIVTAVPPLGEPGSYYQRDMVGQHRRVVKFSDTGYFAQLDDMRWWPMSALTPCDPEIASLIDRMNQINPPETDTWDEL